MPTFTVPRTYLDGDDLYQADLDTAFDYFETSLNTTKLDSANIQAAAIQNANLAPNAISNDKMQNTSVSLANLMDEILQKLTPTGAVNAFAGTAAPTGYLMCDGTAINRTTYANLFAVIGTAFGAPDSSTFNLPDFRGKFLRGVSTTGSAIESRAAQATGGNTSGLGSVQTGATKAPNTAFTANTAGSHTHSYSVGVGSPAVGPYFHERNDHVDATYSTAIAAAGDHTHSISGGDTETRPVNVFVNYIIKI